MPWRNGGGTTIEIAIAPEGASVAAERFLYRVSIADVASDGPFSRFPGYDRHIMLLAGDGMTLDGGEHGRIDLTSAFVPRTFSGDWDVAGELTGGAVRDFNLIVDRASASATLEARGIDAAELVACAAGDVCIVHVIEGELTAASAGDTLIASASFELAPRGVVRVAIARISLRATA
jgi:environmental stress-induced protein Ves